MGRVRRAMMREGESAKKGLGWVIYRTFKSCKRIRKKSFYTIAVVHHAPAAIDKPLGNKKDIIFYLSF